MYKYQRGFSTSGWLLIAAIGGFFLTLFFKLGPAYLDNMSLRSAMKSMVTSHDDIHQMEKGEIYKSMGSYFTINNVRDHNVKELKIIRMKDKTLINHEYEKRIPVMLNVDAVLKFRNQVDSSNIEACCEYLIEKSEK